MAEAEYSVLIRTFNSARTLPYTLECLANQTKPPSQYIFVDSGSLDATLDLAPGGSIVHKYVGREFNYSEAINQGLDFVRTEHVLILSSHALLIKRTAMEFALNVLRSADQIGAAYFSLDHSERLTTTLIDGSNFDGQNGLWNWCSVVRMDLLNRRRFRPEVFAAEDQEWASWLFREEGKSVARISGAGAINYNLLGHAPRKLRNDYVAVAYYAKRERLSWANILRVYWSAISPRGGFRFANRVSQLVLGGRLFLCRFSAPKAKSRYF